MTEKRTLAMSVRVGGTVSIDGDRVSVQVEAKSGRQVRLVFTADSDVSIARADQQVNALQNGLRLEPVSK